MGSFANLGMSDDIQQPEDKVGGGGFSALASNVYAAVIKLAYKSVAVSGAIAINFEFDINGKPYKETIYITNKKGQNFYLDKDNKKQYLPGFITVNDLVLLTTGKPLAELTTEKKVVKIRDFQQKKDVPTEVECLTPLHGQSVLLAILLTKEFKSKKEGDEYVPTDEVREVNSINKVMHLASKRTVAEVKAKLKEGEFINQWLSRWENQVNDKTAGKTPTATAKPVSAGATTATTSSSLFDD